MEGRQGEEAAQAEVMAGVPAALVLTFQTPCGCHQLSPKSGGRAQPPAGSLQQGWGKWSRWTEATTSERLRAPGRASQVLTPQTPALPNVLHVI